ncbi:MAG: 5'/3'-nucleotidase SurE [Myxococcota bacterium]
MAQPRILISNDDGIHARGIRTLAEALEPFGEVWVVAPDRERSATSHSISLHNPLRVREVGERRYTVDGTPTDSVYLALHHLLPGPPDVVFSGINHGPNLGNDVLYSGTVAAAMEGALFGYRAVAMSLCLNEKSRERQQPAHFDTAGRVAADLMRGVMDRPMPPGVLLNVNVPDIPFEDVQGRKLCRLGFNDWAEAVDKRSDPRNRPYYWIGGSRSSRDEVEGSDVNAVADGQVSITPIHYDLTDYRSFNFVRELPSGELKTVPDGLGDQPLAHPVHPKRN